MVHPELSKSADVSDVTHTSIETKTLNPRAQQFAQPVERISRVSSAARWFRERIGGREESSLRDIIEEALEDHGNVSTQLSEEERILLKNIVSFGELTVKDIMVPRTDILALERDVTLEDLLKHVQEIGHTRIPVYHESLDKIEGFIHVKDLFITLSRAHDFSLENVLREVLFVPPSMRIVDLLLKMRVSGCHMAIVVDEYGGTDGLVTMEDLFEEIVGEIQDEHDDEAPAALFNWVSDTVLEADARAGIEDVENVLGTKLRNATEEEEDYDTLGGHVFSTLGRVPVRGEVITRHDFGIKIDIISADPRRIHKVRISLLAPVASSDDA